MSSVNEIEKYAADLEKALETAGIGWFNLTQCAVLMLFPMVFIIEQMGFSLVLLAAACDLNMSNSIRGLVASFPCIGFFLSSYPFGYFVDTQGRKKILIYSSFVVGTFSIMSGLMPDWISFGICKFFVALCLPCLCAVPFIFVEEIIPTKYRDTMISLTNGCQMIGSVLVPLLAMAILPMNFRIDFGVYIFRPWRLLTITYASSFIIAGILMCFFPESPKYLVSQNKYDEALQVLGIIYAGNKSKSPKQFPIDRLTDLPSNINKGTFLITLREQSAPILKWVYLKWMLLMGFILFSVFAIFNGLYIWVPDLLNNALNGGEKGKTVCQVHYNNLNQTFTEDGQCHDNVNEMTLYVSAVGQACCTFFILLISGSVKFIGRKTVLLTSLWFTGASCIIVNFITNEIVMSILLLSLPTSILGLGSVNSFIVEIMPTHLRGVALTVCIMLGTIGAIVTSNVSGFLINDHCETMFYLFGSISFVASAVTFLMPNMYRKEQSEEN